MEGRAAVIGTVQTRHRDEEASMTLFFALGGGLRGREGDRDKQPTQMPHTTGRSVLYLPRTEDGFRHCHRGALTNDIILPTMRASELSLGLSCKQRLAGDYTYCRFLSPSIAAECCLGTSLRLYIVDETRKLC